MKKLLSLVIVMAFVGGCGSDHPADRFCLEEDGKIVCYDPEDCSTDEYGRITCKDPDDPYIEDDPCYKQECTGECEQCGRLTTCVQGFCDDACYQVEAMHLLGMKLLCEDPDYENCPDCYCWNMETGMVASIEEGYPCIDSGKYPRPCDEHLTELSKVKIEENGFTVEEFIQDCKKRCDEEFIY